MNGQNRDIYATLLLEVIEPLLGRISELLLQHGGRRRTAAEDHALRAWEFIGVELSGIVAFLCQMRSFTELLPEYPEYVEHFRKFDDLVPHNIMTCLDHYPKKRDCLARLHCRATALQMPLMPLEIFEMLFLVAESSWRYQHLLQDADSDRNSTTSSSYAADAGGNIFLVGIEGAIKNNKKLRWFMANREDDEALKIISMVGPAGIGKTALVMEVYRQLQLIAGGHYFQCCATVKVSRKPDIKELLKHILSQIDKPAALAPETCMERSQVTMLEDGEHELLACSINQCLQEKRYLIVIDDIWKESDWNIIKDAFPRNSPGSRIMITTQLTSIARLCCSHSANGLVHQVKPMSKPYAERLLFRKAFGPKDGYPQENQKVACDEILRLCEGVPLFIIGAAEWLKEQQQDVQPVSTNYSLEKIPQLPKQFEQALCPTYDDLHNSLKLLLLTMSMFPHGHMLEKDSLIEEWIFKVLMESDHPRDHLVEQAESYFSDLVDRNVITRVAVATPKRTPQVEEACKCQVNYFMLQFFASKSAEKGFVCTSGTLSSMVAQGGKTMRRLSLHQPDPKLPAVLGELDLSHTRSLAMSGEVEGIPLDKFIYLVVLDLEGWQCFKDDDMLRICKMFFLRNLSLRNTGVSKLPPEIKELQLLQTLDISHTRISKLPSEVCELHQLWRLELRSTQVRQLPGQIWKNECLRCLLVGGDEVNRYGTAIDVPNGMRLPHSLRTLATVDLSECSASLVEALGGADRLDVLAITWSFHQCTDRRFQQALLSSIKSWKQLESLTIHCGLGCCMDFLDSPPPNPLRKFRVSGGRFASLPRWFSGLDSLTFIEITVDTLPPGDVGILGKLPRLECLVLGLLFILEEAIVIDWEGFQELERLSVCCRVPWLTFNEGAMPVLTYLELKIVGSPASQESVPSGISNLRRLSDVAICYHAHYTNSPSVKMTVEAVRKGVAEHMPINLFINGIEDQEEYVQAAEEDPARATASQNEIEEVEGSYVLYPPWQERCFATRR